MSTGQPASEWVFVYGSNMNLADLADWSIRHGVPENETQVLVSQLRQSGKVATLPGFRLVWCLFDSSRKGGVCSVKPDPAAMVFGVVYRLTRDWERMFDIKEGYPEIYRRDVHKVTLIDGEIVSALVYSVNADLAHEEGKPPHPDYKRIVVEGAREWGLPDEYIARLNAVAVRSL